MAKRFKIIIVFCFGLIQVLKAQNLSVFSLMYLEKENKQSFVFVSLSELYSFNEPTDFQILPDLEDIPEKESKNHQRIQLNSISRKHFLSKVHISETDIVYIYSYEKNKLISFPVSNLNLVAHLNLYGGNWPYSKYDYMIGLEIDKKYLIDYENYYLNTLVSIGKKSPFVLHQMHPVVWKKIDKSTIPAFPINPNDTSRLLRTPIQLTNAYFYKLNGLTCFLEEYTAGEIVNARRLLVVKSGTKTLICERVYYDHESASPAPLTEQWAGNLFKNKAPVIFGFEYISFGCPTIILVDPNEKDIIINCDNRH
ncbi:MAG: oxidoreductase [Bacteroidia bacterium]|nr:oxidoreductase [Bacteroidia bacterium]MCF8425120.1 oxidoreductase [Bacteroidia bacterium]MCF8446659.1 oxidoreductase [Bacteroidia bacterium]